MNIYIHSIDRNVMSILGDLKQLRHKNVKLWIGTDVAKNNLFLSLGIKDAKCIIESNLNNNISYFYWDISTCQIEYTDENLKNLYHRSHILKEEFIVIDTQKHIKNQIVMFIDAAQDVSLPAAFLKFKCYNDSKSLFNYLHTTDIFDFTLDNPLRFNRNAGIPEVQGAHVYHEISTNRYWYLDMFHKTHYEVFDKNRKHIGEANLNGEIDFTKKVKGRTL